MSVTKAEVREILTVLGWKEDRFGKFHSSKGTVRIVLNPLALRVERAYTPEPMYGYQSPRQWLNVSSDYYRNIAITDDRLVIKGRKIAAMKDESCAI